jgi:hypothetical protein
MFIKLLRPENIPALWPFATPGRMSALATVDTRGVQVSTRTNSNGLDALHEAGDKPCDVDYTGVIYRRLDVPALL